MIKHLPKDCGAMRKNKLRLENLHDFLSNLHSRAERRDG